MTIHALEKLKYPIGKFECPDKINAKHISEWIITLEEFPEHLRNLVIGLSDRQLDTPYRPGGWTIRQVVHHLADSHHHSYIRFKWALTENKPIIKFYYEALWAELFDAQSGPIDMSLLHLKAVHSKLVYLLRGLKEADLNKSFIHPEYNEEVTLKKNIGNYAWHCKHHFAHIENAIRQNGW